MAWPNYVDILQKRRAELCIFVNKEMFILTTVNKGTFTLSLKLSTGEFQFNPSKCFVVSTIDFHI